MKVSHTSSKFYPLLCAFCLCHRLLLRMLNWLNCSGLPYSCAYGELLHINYRNTKTWAVAASALDAVEKKKVIDVEKKMKELSSVESACTCVKGVLFSYDHSGWHTLVMNGERFVQRCAWSTRNTNEQFLSHLFYNMLRYVIQLHCTGASRDAAQYVASWLSLPHLAPHSALSTFGRCKWWIWRTTHATQSLTAADTMWKNWCLTAL